MGVYIERPYAFFGLFLLIPALLYAFYRYKILIHDAGGFFDISQDEPSHTFRRFTVSVKMRCICNAAAWIMLVCAYAGFSWGTVSVPVQKGGNAVAMVFDISYSREAPDAPGGLTRLAAAARYADMLLPKLKGNSVSVIIAKGDGIIEVPLTEDIESIRTLLQSLSPAMMTSSGTSLGKGIRAAIRSFPPNLSQYESIWVFTDGEETDGQLAGALSDSITYGIPVTLIGFGSEREIEITSGDGKTNVKTALRSVFMKKTIASAVKRRDIHPDMRLSVSASYVDAGEAGSALKVLHSLQGLESSESFQAERVNRQGLFLGIAVLFFTAGFLFSELDVHGAYRRLHRTGIFSCILLSALLLTSCGSDFSDSKRILQSTWAWHQKNYRKAVAGFLQTEQNAVARNDTVMAQYALYGLASTYLMQGEDSAALEHLSAISPGAPDNIRFASFYNSGIIAYHKGDYTMAASMFRKALLVDSTNADAKINLELTVRQKENHQSAGTEQTSTALPENSEKASPEQEAIFNRIRENEQKQWKNQQSEKSSSSSLDY